jgi:hypothetical protein
MLKSTTTEYVVVVNNRDLIPVCAANGIRAIHIDEAVTLGEIAGAKAICVDDVNAYDMGHRLLDQGMNRRDVTCVDVQTFANGSRDLLAGGDLSFIRECSRPAHFNMVRSLEDASDDSQDRVRIPSGLPFLDHHLRWRRNEVCVITGPYGCGKSLLVDILAIKWALGDGGKYADDSEREVPAWLCTWEDDPVEQKDQIYRHICHGVKDPDKYQIEHARALARRIYHTHPKFTRTRDLEWYLETVRMMHEDYGTNFFVLDPWSEFDHLRYSHENETEYCKRIMKELNKLSIELGVIFNVVTHLPKSKYSEDGSIKPFRVADAMGSVQFGSSASRGICVLRAKVRKHLDDDRDYLVVHFDKIKIERNMGRKGTIALRYHEDRHALEHCPDASRIAGEMWSGARKEASQ